jgi:hypothetical protein
VVFDVQLGRFRGVLGGMMQVSLGSVCVMRRSLVFSSFVMPGSFAMVPRRVLMVFGCLMMMFRLLGHLGALLEDLLRGWSTVCCAELR